MNKYGFSLILKGPLELTDDIADELFSAGCEDGTPGVCEGVFSIDFNREAGSLEEAICPALFSVRNAGYEVELVSIDAESFMQSA